MEPKTTRINKFLSEAGYCSRREADRLIEAGRITINGQIPAIGTQVGPQDLIAVDGQPVNAQQKPFVYMAFNKPKGIECTTDQNIKDNIVDFIGFSERIFPIGRLDKHSSGLILMTNDGDIVNKILRAKNNHEKEYIVKVSESITPEFIEKMGAGVPILETTTLPCAVKQVSEFDFSIVLTQGMNRQIRRMCEQLDYQVIGLKRVRIMNIKLDVPVGQYRMLTDGEMIEINQLISQSSKTQEASLENTRPKSFKKSSRNYDIRNR
jgi:23S rRNA pseudouridine2604 synthase